jgi:hypothetical protein
MIIGISNTITTDRRLRHKVVKSARSRPAITVDVFGMVISMVFIIFSISFLLFFFSLPLFA